MGRAEDSWATVIPFAMRIFLICQPTMFFNDMPYRLYGVCGGSQRILGLVFPALGEQVGDGYLQGLGQQEEFLI